ncbi:aminotransferase class V-fold PLP-dependent enzyme [Clostridium intestinale]|uniref:cysteine desulfurase n=1 Tax=Clostridium intestinale TaxID=36845 RepID=A0A7D7A143_9CLOT|nr:aminotransferase class V-fold PLP-dependent enzyme [Clostridium intestinale]QLY80435.1 aminotransferase class V-fold PLP-dependent enzyme [Clostridium intestinale]
MIYFDNAATSFPKPDTVALAVANAINTLGNPSRGSYSLALDASRLVYKTREKVSELFNVGNPLNVAFTSNSTEALNISLNGCLNRGDHVITTELEHNSVLRPLYALRERGIDLSIIPSDINGILNYSKIEKEIKSTTKALVCTHGSNLTGNLIDIKLIGEICKKNNLLFILDASQTAGVFPIDMHKFNIDIVCFTGHKSLMGPQGTGGVCIKDNLPIRPLKTGGSGSHSYSKSHPLEMPDALEAGTVNSHSIAGLLAGLEFIEEIGIDKIREKELSHMWKFYNGIKDIQNIHIYGDFSIFLRAPIVTLNLGDYDSNLVCDELWNNYEIATRAGAHCAPLMHEALRTKEQGAVRFSFSYFNTDDEIEIGIKAIKELSTL